MFQLLKCLCGLHGLIEIHRCTDGALKVCQHCLKVKDVKYFTKHIIEPEEQLSHKG